MRLDAFGICLLKQTASSAQSVASPSKLEGFREFEADLSALFCKQNAFGAQSVISPSKNERFRGV